MLFKLPLGLVVAQACLAAVLAGCGSSAGSAFSATAGEGGAGAVAPVASDLPCDVQKLVATKCQICHRVDPPGGLLTSADFSKPSKTHPGQSEGAEAVVRMTATDATHMPPSPLAPATTEELAAFSAWIEAGATQATCQDMVAAPPDPYDTPLVCSGMTTWTGGNRESPLMRPGGACISCHKQQGEGPVFAVAGTVFPTPHEPDDCNGVSSTAGAQVVVTDAAGVVHNLKLNDAGNFSLEARTFALPYRAKVVYQGRERVMVEAQTSGDCNDCHTQDGRMNAPGRIFLP